MKTLLFILFVFVAWKVFADDHCATKTGSSVVEDTMEIKTDVPKFLEGATIIVRLKDGTESVVPADKFKVVPRKQQFIVTKTRQLDMVMCSADKEKNRAALLVGQGPTGTLNVSRTYSKVSVESQVDAVGGLQYQRLVTDKLSLGAQVQTNSSAMAIIGIDF